ncbi:MAG TPA: 6-phosphogluconolactonase [Bryobacteraceae bacterium]|jgi:6-phosphogluconolactonase|nr:6-phosphogluconolactonase [Bryobacteraceae bacterium]
MSSDSPSLRIFKTPEEGADSLAAYILEHLDHDLGTQPRATLAVSGGNTPRLLFARLAAADFDWSRVHLFWVDERCVPITDAKSNFRMTNETLLSSGKIPEANVHRIHGELPPDEAGARYVDDIKQFFRLADDMLPILDIIHRGMGDEGHTASLFPGEPLILNTTDIAAHVWVEKVKMHRVTLLPGVLRAAKRTVLQVAGADKAPAVRAVLTGAEDPMTYPCQIASRDARATWFLDDAAAAQL